MSEGKSGWGPGKWLGCGCGGCVLLILLIVGFAAGVGGLVVFGFRTSDVFEEAMHRARADPEVREAIGEPMEAGWFVSGSFSVNGPSGEARLAIPLSGPNGQGTLYLEAEKTAGEWEFNTLEVEVEESGERIDLLGKGVLASTLHLQRQASV